MAQVPGTIALLTPIVSAFLADDGFEYPQNHQGQAALVPVLDPLPSFADAPNDGGDAGAPHDAAVAVPSSAVVESGFNTGDGWFEQVHVFPGSNAQNPNRYEWFQIDFGNIVSDVDVEYELYSAFRKLSNSVNSTSTLAGIAFPNLSPPKALAPQTSALDPSSTFNSSVLTGLGTLVRLKVRALRDGVPEFDQDMLLFTALGGPGHLPVSGRRIALFHFDWDGDVTETLEFRNWVSDFISSDEQRVAMRKNPRQLLDITVLADGHERRRLEALLFDWHASVFALTVRFEEMSLTANVTGGATPTISVDSTANVDLRIGALAAVVQDDTKFDILTVLSFTSSSITFTSNVQNTYVATAGIKVYPVRLVHLQAELQGARKAVTLARYEVQARVIDNDTGAPTGDASAYPVHNGKILLSDSNMMDGDEAGIERLRKITIIDNPNGVVFQASPWDRDKRLGTKGFVVKTRAQLYQLRRLLIKLGGRRTAFYLPTFHEDFEVVASLNSGASTMDIRNIGYARYVRGRPPFDRFRVTFTDGSVLERTVLSYAEISSTVERLTLNTTWPSTHTAAQVSRVELLVLSRVDTDQVQIRHRSTIGHARCFFPVREVRA